MTTEEMKNAVQAEVERRYQEQNFNELCELYKKIKECLPVSDDRVANNILDHGSWWDIDYILARIEEHPEWREVFPDEIDRLESNREWFVNRCNELYQTEKERERLPWWKRLFIKDTKLNSTNNKEDKR